MKPKEELDAMRAECDRLWVIVQDSRRAHEAACSAWAEMERPLHAEKLRAEIRAEIERENAATVTPPCNCDKQ